MKKEDESPAKGPSGDGNAFLCNDLSKVNVSPIESSIMKKKRFFSQRKNSVESINEKGSLECHFREEATDMSVYNFSDNESLELLDSAMGCASVNGLPPNNVPSVNTARRSPSVSPKENLSPEPTKGLVSAVALYPKSPLRTYSRKSVIKTSLTPCASIPQTKNCVIVTDVIDTTAVIADISEVDNDIEKNEMSMSFLLKEENVVVDKSVENIKGFIVTNGVEDDESYRLNNIKGETAHSETCSNMDSGPDGVVVEGHRQVQENSSVDKNDPTNFRFDKKTKFVEDIESSNIIKKGLALKKKIYSEISFKVSKSSNRNKGSWCVKKAKVRHMGAKKRSQQKLRNLDDQSNDCRSAISECYGKKIHNEFAETSNDEKTTFESGATVNVDRSLSQNDQTADNISMSHNSNQLNDLVCSVNIEHCESHVNKISLHNNEVETRLEDRCDSIDPILHIEAIILQEDFEEDSCDSDDEIPLAQLAQNVRLESQSNDKVFKSVPKTKSMERKNQIGKNRINNYISLENKLSPVEGTRQRKLGLKETAKIKTKPLRKGGVNALSKKKKEKIVFVKTNGKRKKKNVEKLEKLKKIIAQSIRITQNGHERLQENTTKSDNVIHDINQVVVKNKRRAKQGKWNKLEGQGNVSINTDLQPQSSLFTSMREQGLVVRCYGPSKKLKNGNGDSAISPIKSFERKLIRQTLEVSYGEILMNEDGLNHISGQESNAVKENCVQTEREPQYNKSVVQEAVSQDVSSRNSTIPDSENKLMENFSHWKNSVDNEVFNSLSTDASELVNFGAITGNESHEGFPVSRIQNGLDVDYPVTEGSCEVQLVKNGCAFENIDSKSYTEENNDNLYPDRTVDRPSSVSTSISSASLIARKNKLTPFSRLAYVKRRRRKRGKRTPVNSVSRISFLNKRNPLTKIPSPLKTSGSFSVKKRVGRPKKLQLKTNNENSLDCEVAKADVIDSQIVLSPSRKRRTRKMTSLIQVKSLSNLEKLESNTLYDEGDSSLLSADSDLKPGEVAEAISSNDFSDAFKEGLEEREVKINARNNSHLGMNDEQRTIINAAKKRPGRKAYKTHIKDSSLRLASNTNQSRKYKGQIKKKESIIRRSTRISKECINANCTPSPGLEVVNYGDSCLDNGLNQGTRRSVVRENISDKEELNTGSDNPLQSLNLHSASLEANDLSSAENSGNKADPSRTPEGMPAPEEQTTIKDLESVSTEKHFCSTLVDELITYAINGTFYLQEISIPLTPNNYENVAGSDHASGQVSNVEKIKYPNESSVGTAEKFMQEEEIIKNYIKDLASCVMICSNKTLQPRVVQESTDGKMFHTDKAIVDGVPALPDSAIVPSIQYLIDGINILENNSIHIEKDDSSAFVSSSPQVDLFKSEKNEIVGAPETDEERRANSNDEDSVKIRSTVKVISETFLINDVNHISSSDSSDLEVVESYSKAEKGESKLEVCGVYGTETSPSKSHLHTRDNESVHLSCEGSNSVANSEHPKCCTISNTFRSKINQCNIYEEVKDLHVQFEDKINRVNGDFSLNFTRSENVETEETLTEKQPLSSEGNLKESDNRPSGIENKKSQSSEITEALYNHEYLSMSTSLATKTLERKGLKESAEDLYTESHENPKTSSKKPKITESLIKIQSMFTENSGNELNEGTQSKGNQMKKSVVEESSPDLQIIAELKHCKTQTEFMHVTLNPAHISTKASRPSSTYQIRMKSLDKLIDDDVVVIGETRRQPDIIQKEHTPQLQESPLKKIEELTERQKFLNNNDKYSLTSILNQSLTKGLIQKGRKIRVKATNSGHYPSSTQIEKKHSLTRKITSKTNSIIQSPTNNPVAQMSCWNPSQNMTNIFMPPILPVINRTQVQALTTPPSTGDPSQVTLSPPTSVSQIICSPLPISQPVVFIPMNVMGFDVNLPEVSRLPSPPPLAHAPTPRNTKKSVTTIGTERSLNRPPLVIPSPDVSIIPVTFDNSAKEATLPSVAKCANDVTTIVKKDPSYGSCNEYNCTCKGCLTICSSPMSSLPSVICDSPATVSSENDKIIKGSINPMTLNVKKKDCVPGEIIWTCLSGSPFWPSVVSSDGKNGCIKYTAKGLYVHVNFLNDMGRRAWIHRKSTLTYNGKDHFLGTVQTMKRELMVMTRNKLSVNVPPKYLDAWEEAVRQAEDLRSLNRQSRLKFAIDQAQNFANKKKKLDRTLQAVKLEEGGSRCSSIIESVSSEIEIVEVREADVIQQNPSINKGNRQLPSLIPFSPSVLQPKAKEEEVSGSLKKGQTKMLARNRTKTEESGLKPKRKYVRKSFPDFEMSSKKLKTNSPAVITSGNKRRSQDLKISIKKNVTVFQKPKSSGEATVNVKSTVEMSSSTSSRIPTITAMCSLEPKSRPILIELSDDETDIKTKLSLTKAIQGKKQVFTPNLKNNTKLASPPPAQTPPCLSRSNSVESRLSDLSLFSNRGVKRKRSMDSSEELRARKRHILCLACSETRESPFLKCKSCRAPYHSYCEPNLSTNGKCRECLKASTICFICKKSSGDLKKCSQNPCVKFYHKSCLDDWPQTKRMGNSFICPLHICHTCSSEDESQTSLSDKLQKCALCPTAYHAGDTCLAAGSESYNNVVIKCSKHLRSSNSLKHTSAPWCFICAKGGHLICCDHCPSSFHLECLKITEQPEGSFVCVDCETGRLPLYHDIVWVKLGAYRWWPAQIRKPEEIPENVQNLPHSCGEFCVQFFGTHDYYWVNRGRCFFYQEDDTACKNGYKARFQKGYEAAMVEATEAYKRCIEERQKVLQLNSLKSDKKPPPYAKIKTNRPVGNVKVYECEDPDFLTPCGCDPDLEHPCGEDSACINRLTLIECHPKVCKAGEKCENQRFTRKNYPNLLPIKTPGRGWGLRCLEDIKRGTFIIEYVGELIDIQEYHCRIEEKKKHRDDDHYFLSLDNTRIIDAGPKGNLARFMNHCCSPNCKTEKWTVNGDTRVGLFSIQDIPAGTELTFNYQFESLAGGEKKPCLCGAANCGGFIGVKVKNAKEKKPEVDKTKRIKKRKVKEKKHTEDECFRCGDGGDLVLCDVTKCPKGYHLSCLNLNKLPGGSWMCPWHHCDECGCRAARYCQRCPNSFCLKHSTESNVRFDDNNELMCSDHFDQ